MAPRHYADRVKNVRVRRLLILAAGTIVVASCSADSEPRSGVKNASAGAPIPGPAPEPPPLALATTLPDKELSVTLPTRSDGAAFGTRVAIQRGMIFASASGRVRRPFSREATGGSAATWPSTI